MKINYNSTREKYVVEYLHKKTELDIVVCMRLYKMTMRALDYSLKCIDPIVKIYIYCGFYLKFRLNREKTLNLIKSEKNVVYRDNYKKFFKIINDERRGNGSNNSKS